MINGGGITVDEECFHAITGTCRNERGIEKPPIEEKRKVAV